MMKLSHILDRRQIRLWKKGRADAIAEMQKEWSEEDNYYRNCIIQTIEEINNAPLKRLEDWDAYINWLKSLRPQPKQEWSEDDIVHLNNCISFMSRLSASEMNWLKSLKNRVQPKQEWNDKKNEYEKLKNSSEEVTKNKENAKDFLESSGIMDKDGKLAPQYRLNEEDEVYYNDICELLTNLLCSKKADINKNAIQKDINWLQSIKPQNRWKPSEEQLKALDAARHSDSFNVRILDTLFHDLKKLKEE